jgi:hypothetical protein
MFSRGLAKVAMMSAVGFMATATALAVPLAGTAGAGTPTAQIVTSGPYTSGEQIEISGSGFDPGVALDILECPDPGGALPGDVSGCDANTHQGDTVVTDGSGNFDYVPGGGFPPANGYTL